MKGQRPTSLISRLRRFWDNVATADAMAPPTSRPVPPNVSQMEAYADLCRRAGVNRLYLLMTFDCDTDEDIAAAADVNRHLASREIKAGYAVPGVQMIRGAEAWRRLADSGAEFLNHGFQSHAEWRDGQYRSITFYDKMDREDVREDIRRGHSVVTEVIGQSPIGFRAPHFGCFQGPEQLGFLYDTLKPLGYRYASTTIPAMALDRGPLVDMGGIVEIPTMGSYRYPPTILDSWTYLVDRIDYRLGEEYHELFAETVETMIDKGMPGILTYYADPSHVVDQRPFKSAIDLVSRHRIPTLHGRDALTLFRPL